MDALERAERFVFRQSLSDPAFFRRFARPFAYFLEGGDPEGVHARALDLLNSHVDELPSMIKYFVSPDLWVDFCGRQVMPFGTAAGLDKNADALRPLSYIFGFQEIGTIVVDPREGNERPRVVADAKTGRIFNAQGFPSRGLEYTRQNLDNYRQSGGNALILASICGLPIAEDYRTALGQMETLVRQLGPYVDGWVWNPFSPNTAALMNLRTPESFGHHATILSDLGGDKPRLVKVGPYMPSGREETLDLLEAWMSNSGTGFVAVNTDKVDRSIVPSKSWGYPSAGVSGTHLQTYRQRTVSDMRREYPNATIIATGGIDSGDQAFAAFEAGADLLEGYTPYTFHGFGLLPEMIPGLRNHLHDRGYTNLKEYQQNRRVRLAVA